jgi:hypothetical protein
MRTQLHPKTALQYLHIAFIVVAIVYAIHYTTTTTIIINIYSRSVDPNLVTESWIRKWSKEKKLYHKIFEYIIYKVTNTYNYNYSMLLLYVKSGTVITLVKVTIRIFI